MIHVMDTATRCSAGIVVKYTNLSDAIYGFKFSWIGQLVS